jgi:hypothetical protein
VLKRARVFQICFPKFLKLFLNIFLFSKKKFFIFFLDINTGVCWLGLAWAGLGWLGLDWAGLGWFVKCCNYVFQNFTDFDECAEAKHMDCYYQHGRRERFQYTFFCGNAQECFKYGNKAAVQVIYYILTGIHIGPNFYPREHAMLERVYILLCCCCCCCC